MTVIPIESELYPGYYEIPGYADYVINKEGNVKVSISHRYRPSGMDIAIINDGIDMPRRIYIWPRKKENVWRNNKQAVLIAKLLLLTFIGPKKLNYYRPCYRDFNSLNLSIDNLYWDSSKAYIDKQSIIC